MVSHALIESRFKSMVRSAQASALAQMSHDEELVKESFSPEGIAAANVIRGVVPRHLAYMPGLVSARSADRFVGMFLGKESHDLIDQIRERSAILSSVRRIDGRMVFSVPTGSAPLSVSDETRLTVAMRYLELAVKNVEQAESYGRTSSGERVSPEKANKVAIIENSARKELLDESVRFLALRNELAQAGFDVSRFDRAAEERKLLPLVDKIAVVKTMMVPETPEKMKKVKKAPSSDSGLSM